MTSRPPLLPATVAVHGATHSLDGDSRASKAGDAVATPIVLSSTFGFQSTADLRDFFEGRSNRHEYARYGTPTVLSAERALASLERAEDCALFGSGMAAITTSLLAMLKAGDHVVLTSDCYRRTRQFVEGTLSRFGVTATLVEPGAASLVERAIVPGKTRVVLAEAPSNPYLRIADIPALAEVTHRHRGTKLAIDATFATPINLRPLEHGADIVLHSGTKYLGGHNDLLAGSVAGSSALVSAIREMRGVLGGVLDPHAAYLLERGMKTLALRVARHNESGLVIARFLANHPNVETVHYPALASHPDHEVFMRLMTGAGGVVTFTVRGGIDAGSRFVDALKIATIAPSLGGVETLVEQPALMSFYELTTEERLAIGIPDNLIRLSVGIEECADLIDDLTRALERVAG